MVCMIPVLGWLFGVTLEWGVGVRLGQAGAK